MLQIEPRVAGYLSGPQATHRGPARTAAPTAVDAAGVSARGLPRPPWPQAERYRLFDLDRLEKMVLRQIADDYFVLALEPESGDE